MCCSSKQAEEQRKNQEYSPVQHYGDKAITHKIEGIEEVILQLYLYPPDEQQTSHSTFSQTTEENSNTDLEAKCHELKDEVATLQQENDGLKEDKRNLETEKLALENNKLIIEKEVEQVNRELFFEKLERTKLQQRLKAFQTPVTGKKRLNNQNNVHVLEIF